MTEQSSILDSVETESRTFPPPAGFARRARFQSLAEYQALYRRSIDAPKQFWGEQAQALAWQKPFERVLDWQPPHARWFVGGQLNVSANCLDRHVAEGHGQKVALIWEG